MNRKDIAISKLSITTTVIYKLLALSIRENNIGQQADKKTFTTHNHLTKKKKRGVKYNIKYNNMSSHQISITW